MALLSTALLAFVLQLALVAVQYPVAAAQTSGYLFDTFCDGYHFLVAYDKMAYGQDDQQYCNCSKFSDHRPSHFYSKVH